MAVEEINAKGGVTVGGKKRLFKVSSPSTSAMRRRGCRFRRPCLGIEKLILEKKLKAIVVGPFRSEALMAGMDIIAKYKVPMLAPSP